MASTVVTAKDVLAILGLILGTPAFIGMCWKVAEFAISAKKDIKNILEVIKDMKVSFSERSDKLETRVTELEHKEIARTERERAWQGGDS